MASGWSTILLSEVHDKLHGRFFLFFQTISETERKAQCQKDNLIEKMTSSSDVCTYKNHILGPLEEFVALDK